MRFVQIAGGLAIVSGLLAGTASAEEALHEAQQSPNPHINCTCRANGRNYALGERVCLRTAKGYRLAECRMQQNVTNWSIGQEDCSVSAWLDQGGTSALGGTR